MKKHDPKAVDYVLAEWVVALSTGCREATGWKMLNLYGLKKDLPSVYPEKTAMFVKEQLGMVQMTEN